MSKPRPGWVEAPGFVVQELRLVWQEDEMPEELKSMPGYTPFTLSPDAQAWVDSMQEVREENGTVVGHPRPVVPREHVIKSQPSVPAPPATTPYHPYDASSRVTSVPPMQEVEPRPLPVIGSGQTSQARDDERARKHAAENWEKLLAQRKKEVNRVEREAAERQRTAELFAPRTPARGHEPDRGIPEIG